MTFPANKTAGIYYDFLRQQVFIMTFLPNKTAGIYYDFST